MLVVLFGFFSIGAYVWIGRELPDPDRIADRDVAESSKIYARDGSTLLYEIFGKEKRTVIKLTDMPEDMKWATIAIEDQDFYSHSGFDVKGIIRSLWKNLTSGSRVGGSTITQQLVKNAILSPEKTFTRKFKELILSFQIERRFSKDEILQLYFNEIPYGSSAYGIEAAAQSYFGKSAKDLTLAQAALLAALPQAPTYYSPYGDHTEALVARAHHVIDLMLQEGYISKENAEAAKAEDILSQVVPRRDIIRAPHFVIWVRNILAETYGDQLLERGGLRVTTTLDPKIQTAAEEAVAKYAERNENRYGATNAAAVAIDPKTGQVLAMVGSRDYFDTDNDGNVNVALSVRNPGSSFKPFVYATAFARGYTPETILFDLNSTFGADGTGKLYEPKNYDLTERGPVSMRQALAGSLNIPAVKTLYLAGVQNTLDLAERAGYTTLGDRDQYGLALALGGGGVKLIEHVAAFSSFANDGMRHEVAPILKVTDRKGSVLEEYEEREPIKVMDADIAHTIANILSDNDARAFVFGSRNFLTLGNRPVGAKTGTTNDFRDAWTVGFTPSIAAGVWVGNNDNSEMRRGAAGAVVAAPIWNALMRGALEGTPVESFPQPPKTPEGLKPVLTGSISGAEPIPVDRVTKKRIPESCTAEWPEEFVETVELREAHTILHYVKKEDPRGDPPKNPTQDPLYDAWEGPVRAWAEENGYIAEPPEEEDCALRNGKSLPVVSILSPESNAAIQGDALEVRVGVTGAYPIKSTTLSIDEEVIGEQRPDDAKTKKFKPVFELDTSSLSSGFHTITVGATDIYDNIAADSLRVNIVNGSGAVVYFLSPAENFTVSEGDFPLSIRAFASAPDTIEKVELYFRANGEDTVVATALNPDKDELSLVWQEPPLTGGELYLVMTTGSGSASSDFLTVTL